ncbi:MAG TPA: UDP-3-O-acyl-N-acetylglucosamine deacetylase [Dongiaceae bacterium]|nr:UDP-3-O-acyl-N-acetylglucosamine deacetylase [Dongiaceae bacterium]
MSTHSTSTYFQHTLNRAITFVGRGLHTGLPVRMMIQPAPANTGHIFIRQDVPLDQAEVPARWNTVVDTRLSTTVSNRFGVKVSTIEHLMAALHACGVDNARIVLNGPEVPIMDGSSEPFVRLIRQVGLLEQKEERRVILVRKQVRVEEEGKSATFLPNPSPWIDMTIEFECPAIGYQQMSLSVDAESFERELANARTFGFEDQIQTLRKLGLAKGGSLQNAVLLNEKGVVNPEGLRHANEFVRHKILDAVGDLSLAGMPIIGRFNGVCSGHDLNNRLLRKLLQNTDCWTLTTARGAEEYWNWTQLEKMPSGW